MTRRQAAIRHRLMELSDLLGLGLTRCFFTTMSDCFDGPAISVHMGDEGTIDGDTWDIAAAAGALHRLANLRLCNACYDDKDVEAAYGVFMYEHEAKHEMDKCRRALHPLFAGRDADLGVLFASKIAVFRTLGLLLSALPPAPTIPLHIPDEHFGEYVRMKVDALLRSASTKHRRAAAAVKRAKETVPASPEQLNAAKAVLKAARAEYNTASRASIALCDRRTMDEVLRSGNPLAWDIAVKGIEQLAVDAPARSAKPRTH